MIPYDPAQMLTLTKIAETSTTITLGWSPPANVGGYVFYANGQVVSVATAKLKDGTLRKDVKFSKTSPGPPYDVTAVCRASNGSFTLEVGTYTGGGGGGGPQPVPGPGQAYSDPTPVVTT